MLSAYELEQRRLCKVLVQVLRRESKEYSKGDHEAFIKCYKDMRAMRYLNDTDVLGDAEEGEKCIREVEFKRGKIIDLGLLDPVFAALLAGDVMPFRRIDENVLEKERMLFQSNPGSNNCFAGDPSLMPYGKV